MWIELWKDIQLSVPVFVVKMLQPYVYPVVIVLRLSDFFVFGLRCLNVVLCIHHWNFVWCRTLFAWRVWGGVVGVCFLVWWECFVEPGAQVDVDEVSRRHSTLLSWARGENVVALHFSSGDYFTFE